MTFFTSRSNLVTKAFLWENGKTVDILETIAASGLKLCRCRQLIQEMKVRESMSFLDLVSSRFCIFCAYTKYIGERLQDNWSSGFFVRNKI